MNTVKFSIGIPAYKTRFLKECIDSILAQTYTNFELIIVNDASPEDIDSIVQSYSDNPIIHYYKNKKNFGAENVVDNWNKCLSFAQGEYFVLMGDDDKMEPDYLDEFNNLINRYPSLGAYHCRTKVINEKSEFVSLTEARPEFESVYSMIWHRMIGRIQFISDFLYHTKTLKDNGGFYKLPLAWCSDDISAYIAVIQTGIANTNKPVFNYRSNSSTISSTGNINLKMRANILEREWITDFITKNNPLMEEEKWLSTMIRKKLSTHLIKKQVLTLSSYMKTNGVLSSFVWFMKNRSNLTFSFSMFLYSCIEYIKLVKRTDNSIKI